VISPKVPSYSYIKNVGQGGNQMIFAVPWWVYVVISGIIFSAYMVIRTARNEQEIENSFIENEGQVYIERMNQEKEGRKVRKPEAM
jgi:hypothetical protein